MSGTRDAGSAALSGDGLTAVVLNWRTPAESEAAARSLIEDGVSPGRVLLVDNGSADGSVERLRSALPACPILALPDNLGFAAAHNRATAALPARTAYLFVNSDASVHRAGSVAALLAALTDWRVGISVPRLLGPDLELQPNVVPLSTPLTELVRASGVSRWVPNALQPWLATHWDHRTSRRIQAAQGPVLLIGSQTWEELGGLAEHSHMYAEDLDLFWRARAAGWRASFVAEAEFVHLGGLSAGRRWTTAERAARVAEAEGAMLQRHLGPARARLTLAAMIAGATGRELRDRLRRNPEAAAVHRAWRRGYRSARRSR